jgi:putative restriction endonuclease
MTQNDYLVGHLLCTNAKFGNKIACSGNPGTLPISMQIYTDNDLFRIRMYIGLLCKDGSKKQSKSEYQLSVEINCFNITGEEKTLVLGWWEDADIFVGFDVRRHLGKLRSNLSFRIREDTLRNAYINGFEPCYTSNKEIAIAFKPEFFVEYVRDLETLHDFSQSPEAVEILREISKNPETDDAIIKLHNTVQKATALSVRKCLRDISFQNRIQTAYGNRCAFCGSLESIEAAHIIPVTHNQSTNETRNGLALCALHHKAYDQSLIAVNDDYAVLLNRSQVVELQNQKLAEGLSGFSQGLRPIILLPPAISDRPHFEFIRIANKIRGW